MYWKQAYVCEDIDTPARHVVKMVNKKVNVSFSGGQTLNKEPIFICNIFPLI